MIMNHKPEEKIERLRLEPSIFGTKPSEDLTRCISDFLFKFADLPNIEIEGKLGLLVDKHSSSRISLPVLTETVIAENQSWLQFDSDMSERQHANYNKLFNSRFSETQDPRHKGSKLYYKHTKEIDRYFNTNGTRFRVTVDKETNKVIRSITKKKVAKLDIYSPRTRLDFRISINQEIPVDFTENDLCLMERQKDRISYKHDLYSFDLTKVFSISQSKYPQTYGNSNPRSKVSHELEVEIDNLEVFTAEMNKAKRNSPNQLSEIVQVFVNNMKVLAKHAI
ncbi:hypothetical protein BB559_001005 [Furculomyces boomerangus]|uniref:mRNA-capping enzyme subunit beta n=1 Tax=Furculomyces boomerangus TaxID=61424 RepID=A0A2T9Z3D0_9FUNG|nr:hypothetical protein BB559_001005 [Furculomyces boomerangus]